jgi:hypothetical protein
MNTVMKTLTVALVLASFSATSAMAFDYKKTINLAGKQRMLTQKMSKEAALIALDVNKDANLGNLKNTRDLFDKTLAGLKDGDADLGLEKTKKPKIRKQLDKVAKLWKAFDVAVSGVVSGAGASAEQITVIASTNLPLLKEMNKGVKFYEAASAKGGTNPALAKAINLAGKQRMLTQKMSKEFFLAKLGHDADTNNASLKETIALFDKTLNGLISGDDSMGLAAAPSDEVKGQLEKVKGLWGTFKSAIEGGEADAVAAQNIPLLKAMNAAVQMYEKM